MEKKAELGTKRICPSCAARFYDLSKRPIVCPKCQMSFEPEALLRPRRQRPEAREAPVPQPVEAAEEEEAAEALEGDEEEVTEDEPLEEGTEGAEDEPKPGKPAGPAAKRRKRPPAVVEDDIELPVSEDDEVAVDDEDEGVLVKDEDLDDETLSDIDPDLEDEGPKTRG